MNHVHNVTITSIHTGDESCPVAPLHDPCHTGSREDGRTLKDMSVTGLLLEWRRQVRGTTAGPDGKDLAWLRSAIEQADAYLDAAAPPAYRDNPLANRWRRISGGPGCEVHEATEALAAVTGSNPRKGVHGSESDVLGELGDTAFSALLAIQSQVKDIGATWVIFIEAAAKALSRVPDGYR